MDALAVEMWTRNILQDDLCDNIFDHYGETWRKGLSTTFSDAAVINAKMHSLSPMLNLNNIWYAEDDDFTRTLQWLFMSFGINSTVATGIVNAIQD